jgi:hypothetical protein
MTKHRRRSQNITTAFRPSTIDLEDEKPTHESSKPPKLKTTRVEVEPSQSNARVEPDDEDHDDADEAENDNEDFDETNQEIVYGELGIGYTYQQQAKEGRQAEQNETNSVAIVFNPDTPQTSRQKIQQQKRTKKDDDNDDDGFGVLFILSSLSIRS